MAHIFISTAPFAKKNKLPVELLDAAGHIFKVNPLGRRLTESELIDFIGEAEVIIAGTERISARVMDAAPNLKLISRVGIGLDNVDLQAARHRSIKVSYTPDAPAPAVAELTIGLMLSLLRHIHLANADIHNGTWNRYFGRRISEITIGIIGAGRIGGRVIRRLAAFGSPRILASDLKPRDVTDKLKIEWTDKNTIFREADVISLHLPLTQITRNLIRYNELKIMKNDSLLINTSRGGIVNELDLCKAISEGQIGGAAIDVFEDEPYSGDLARHSNCLLTAHMGSMSEDCRIRMEIEATEEVVRFLDKAPLANEVPDQEYLLQAGMQQK